MAHYTSQLNVRIFLKGYGFFSFVKNVGKNIGKNISKNLSGKSAKNHVQQFATDAFKNASKRAILKTAEATGDFLVMSLLIKLGAFKKIHNRIIHKQLQISIIKKYLKKDLSLL